MGERFDDLVHILQQLKDVKPVPAIDDCEHVFDVQHEEPWSDEHYAQRGWVELSSDEIRKRWPRRRCTKCGSICYESYAHYIAGDW